MSEEVNDSIDIRSRIEQLPGHTNTDSNGNVTHLKPKLQPRRRHKTEEITLSKLPVTVTRSASNPSKKPLIPTKPKPLSSLKPQVAPRVKSPEPPKKPDISRYTNNIEKPTVQTNKPNRTSNNGTNNNKTQDEKPRLSQKPLTANRPNSLSTGKVQHKPFSYSHESWKKTAGPPKRPVPSGPSTKDLSNLPKPPRGRDRNSKNEYENHGIDPNRVKSVSSIASTTSNNRRSTLDGQMILSTHKTQVSGENSYMQ